MSDYKLEKETMVTLVDNLKSMKNYEALTLNASNAALTNHLVLILPLLIQAARTNKPHIIIDTMPWMYFAYHSQGFKYEFFLREFEYFKKNTASISDDKELLKKIHEIINSIINNHEIFVYKATNYKSIKIEVPQEYFEEQQVFKQALITGDISKTHEIFENSVNTYQELHDFYNHIVSPSMYEIGIEWENGTVSVAQEHLASSTVVQTVALSYTKFGSLEMDKGLAIVGAVANEFHELGAMMLANSFELEGWDIIYLGPNVSEERFLEEIQSNSPVFVALSVSMPYNLSTLNGLIEKIQALQMEKIPKVMIGGRAFEKFSFDSTISNADIYLKDINHALIQANQWRS